MSSLSKLVFGFRITFILFLFPSISQSADINIAWSSSPDPKVVGYCAYCGLAGPDSELQADARFETKISLPNLRGGDTYSFTVATHDAAGRESRYSSKTTVLDLKDKDTHFLSFTPSSPKISPSTPGAFAQEKAIPYTAPACEFFLFPAMHSVTSSGGIGVVGISTNLNCLWRAIAHDPWVIITSNDSGAGSQMVHYMVKPNPGESSRQGTLTVAGQTCKITQAGRARHALSITKIGPGTGTVTSIPAETDFETGTLVILMAAPSANSDFVGWSGPCSGTSATCAVTVTSPTLINAIFRLKNFAITASAGANGSVYPSGRVVVNYGGSQKFIFKPTKGYQVDQVRVDGVSVGKPETLLFGNVMSSHRIDALFSPLQGRGKK